jgi:hypothetical protein
VSPVKRINKPQSLGSFFRTDSHLRALLEQLQGQNELLQQVQAQLPEALRPHCHAAHIQDGQLVLFTDSPAWVMRLRFSTAQILTALRTTRPNLRGMRVRVQLPQRRSRRPQGRARLSEDARRHLRETADGLDNGPLQAALERLSRSG